MTIDNKLVENNQLVEAPTPKKRGRKPNLEKKKLYFSEIEEEAFITYCNSNDENVRNKIFITILYPAFTKMVESIIRRYVLFNPGEEFIDTFNDTMSHLMMKVNHFDPQKKSKDGKPVKAYSYCGTICKNYLIQRRKTTQKGLNKNVSYDIVYNDLNPDLRISDDESVLEILHFNQKLMLKTADEIEVIIQKPERYKLNPSDVKVGLAIVDILRNWDNIFKEHELDNSKTKKYTKAMVNDYIKEATLLSTKDVRNAKKKYAMIYFKIKEKALTE